MFLNACGVYSVAQMFLYHIGIHIGRRSSVLQIATSIDGTLFGYSNACLSRAHAGDKLIECHRYRTIGQSGPIIPASIRVIVDDVFRVVSFQLRYGCFDCGKAAHWVPHCFGAKVGVRTGAKQVVRHWFGVKGHANVIVLCDALQQKSCHPHIVANGNAFARTDLWEQSVNIDSGQFI